MGLPEEDKRDQGDEREYRAGIDECFSECHKIKFNG
jgi:hypothetical protein